MLLCDSWYVLRCQGQSELAVAEWLRVHCACNTYVPMKKRFVYPRRRKSKKPVEVQAPAFAGYVFATAEDIFRVDHVAKALCSRYLGIVRIGDGEPSTMADTDIIDLRRQLDCVDAVSGVHPLVGKFVRLHDPLYADILFRVSRVLDEVASLRYEILGKEQLKRVPVSEISRDFFI